MNTRIPSILPFAMALGLVWTLGCESGDPGESGSSVVGNESGIDQPDGPGESTGGVDTPVTPVDLCPEKGCDSVLDQTILEQYAKRDVFPVDETADRLCRRLAVDLWGRVPSWKEVEELCIGKSPAESVDAFLDSPQYVAYAQRRWADDFEYNDSVVWWQYIEDLDKMVGALYSDELSYPDFASAALIHPAFISRYDGDALVGAAFRIFMARDALVAERKDLIKLWNIWDTQMGYDNDWYLEYAEVVVDLRKCSGTLNKSKCTASLYGGAQVILPLVDVEDPMSDNNVLGMDQLSDADLAVLNAPGDLFRSMDVFYEAAVDKVLSRFLGYQAGVLFGVPIDLVPDLRLELMEVLHASGGSIRAVEREVLASRLYIQSARRPETVDKTDDSPFNDMEANHMIDRAPWAYGPTKQMRVEAWMNSIQNFAGYGHTEAWAEGYTETLTPAVMGNCDYRYPNMEPGEITEDEMIYHPSNYPLADAAINRPDFMYRDFARNLGGCPNHVQFTRFTGTGVILSLESTRYVNSACFQMTSSGMFPTDHSLFDVSTEGLTKLIVHQFRNALTRDPSEAEVSTLLGVMQGCLAQSDKCPPEVLGRKVCAALMRTTDFLYY